MQLFSMTMGFPARIAMLAQRAAGVRWMGLWLALLFPLLSVSTARAQSTGDNESRWIIKKTGWNADDERLYERLITAIGTAVENRRRYGIDQDPQYLAFEKKCKNLQDCLTDPDVNFDLHDEPDPHRREIIGNIYVGDVDCSKLAHIVRAYVAWRRGLPFSFVTGVAKRFADDHSENDTLRYTRGNKVVQRYDVTGTGHTINSVIARVTGNVSTMTVRVLYDKADAYPPDFYIADLTPADIKPGTIIYNVNGHMVVVYKTDSAGRVWYVDSHPDNSLSVGLYGPEFPRGRPSQGAGFQKWRSIELKDAHSDPNGELVDGVIQVQTSAAGQPLDKLTQYLGTKSPLPTLENWSKAVFQVNSKVVAITDYVRSVLVGSENAKIVPKDEVKVRTFALCLQFGARVEAVELASSKAEQDPPISSLGHPDRLPVNIYGTQGTWETYASPSRDARVKAAFADFRYVLASVALTPPQKNELLSLYLSKAKGCRYSYVNSAGVKIPLTLEEIRARMFRLSFDPYHCPEQRWGAAGNGIASCPQTGDQDQTKMKWYEAEQRLRNSMTPEYEAKMDYDLAALKTGARLALGVASPPDICIVKVLGGTGC